MTSITLGLSGAIGHDAAAALFVDNELVAAVEEERLIRRKYATKETPYHAARQCFQIAGIRATDVDQVAIPYAPASLFTKARWHYAYRHWYAPDRSIVSLFAGNRRYRRYLGELKGLLEKLHIPAAQVKIHSVPHQLAHASSVYHLNETEEKTAIFCNDSRCEYSNIFLGYGHQGKIHRIKEFYNPDSLCGMYAAVTDYLGFDMFNGEFKVMGISPFGDPDKYDLTSLAKIRNKKFYVDTRLIGTVGLRRYKAKSKGHYFSQKLVDMLGPRRVGNLVDDPYVHYAAAIQKLYEDMAVRLIELHLGKVLEECGRLVVAGTGSLNIRLNQRLAAMPQVKELIVHSAAGDSGTAIGAASYAVRNSGTLIKPVSNMFLGPRYTRQQCIEACRLHREKPVWQELENPHEMAAELLAQGELVAWFRGRMEFGSRGLGNRSVLANPTIEDISETINKRIKFRESWRPFSPSVLDSAAQEFLGDQIRDEYMCVGVTASDAWREKYPALFYPDGGTLTQVVREEVHPDFYRLLQNFLQRTGHPLLIKTSFCRPGEALVCTPEDALNTFMGTDLQYLILEDLLITRRPRTDHGWERGESR